MAGKLNKNAVEIMINICSSKEIDMMLYFCKVANEFGSCRDIYYADVCLELDMSKQSFYNCIDSLVVKGLITRDMYSKTINVQILNNIFLDEKHYKEGYINFNYDFVYSKEFIKSKLNIKRTALIILAGYMDKKDKYIIKVSTLCRKLELTKSWLLNEYLEVLKTWFKIDVPVEIIGTNSGNKVITFIKENVASTKSIRDRFLENKIISICRRFKVAYTTETLKELLTLFRQYYDTKKDKLMLALDSIIRYRSIEPKLINYIVNNTNTGTT